MHNNDNIKNIITYKFKRNLWWDKELEYQRKLTFHKEVTNPRIKYKKYLYV